MYNPQVTDKNQLGQASNTNMNSDTSFGTKTPLNVSNNVSNNYSHGSSRINNNEEDLNSDKNQAAKHSLTSTTPDYESSDHSTGFEKKKPVADKNAFVESEDLQKHWQHSMEPGDRAKELAEEMKQGRTSDDLAIKIGDGQQVRRDK